MISALDEMDSVVRCIEMGAEDYLAKPFNPILLKARVGACLEQKRLRDQESLYLAQLAQANEKITSLNGRLEAENMRLSAELEITKRLQMMLLPKEKELSQIENLEIAGFMEPADEFGGDYYDVLQHHGRITIGIGDVTGHGLESGVLMLMVQTAVRTLMENNETEPKKFFEVLNRTIYKNVQRMDSNKNLSLCLVNYHQGLLSLSGQHEELVVVRSNGAIERIDTVDLGFPIGLEETIEDFVFQAQVQLNTGDVVVLYTDGVTEAENNLGNQYGLENLCAIVKQSCQQSAQDIKQSIIANLRSHIGVQKVYDDITLVVLKQK
jgi:sigma-B regulation protein RsbU (phosphoserine phosphatase)